MDTAATRARLQGCYVTIPTMFHDDEALSVDYDAVRRHVQWVIEGGCTTGDAVLLAGGAAGEFSTLTFDERVAVAAAVVEAAAGRVPVAMGGQTTSTLELVRLAKAAERVGAEYLQVSPPFYFDTTEGDFHEHVIAAANAADVGLIIYNTFWTSLGVSSALVEKLADIPNVVGLKWATSDSGMMEFEQVVSRFSDRFAIIDNQMRYVTSHILGARSVEVHQANYWPEWSVGLWRSLERREYADVQREMVRVAMPFMVLLTEMLRYTGGEGYLEKLCMELIGRGTSRNRPPTRDVRTKFRAETRQMLLDCGVPGVVPA
ncbi:MAG TPA: dihydrodipicolinate synthase family protein [Candidatus Saccharimonadales bacterium]|nr:dihydrodipicolinate synthase family protein [Candidatus Saccharimonadales bacterium]